MAWSDEARAAAAATRKAKAKHPAKGAKVASAIKSTQHTAKISLSNVRSVLSDPTRIAKAWKANARGTPAVAAMSDGGIKRAGNFWGLRHK